MYYCLQAVSNEKALQQELEHKYISIKNQIRQLKSGDMLRIEGGETIKQNLRVAHSNLQQAKNKSLCKNKIPYLSHFTSCNMSHFVFSTAF